MNFKGHFMGGVASGGLLIVGLSYYHNHSGSPLYYAELVPLFLITVFFALFPDLDVGSIPQRWFYRVVFLCLIVLSLQNALEVAVLLALVSLLPILSYHRGWTHRWWAPLVTPLLLALLYEYWRHPQEGLHRLSWDGVWMRLRMSFDWVLASWFGWWTHFLLDRVSSSRKRRRKGWRGWSRTRS